MWTPVRLPRINMVSIYVWAAFEDFPNWNVKIYIITFLFHNLWEIV